MTMVRPRVPFRDVAWMWRSQGTQRSSLSWRVDWRETSESDDETMRKCTPEEIKPECPNAPAMVLYPVHWAEMELCSQNSSPHVVPCWCQPWGDFCTRSGRRKWSGSTTLFVVSVAASTLPCDLNLHLTWASQAPATLLLQLLWVLDKVHISSRIEGTSFPYKLPPEVPSLEVMRKMLVPVNPEWFQLSSQVEVPAFLSNHQSGQPQ